MRRVLVPLDGTDSSTAILDDAVRLAGSGGTLILVQEVRRVQGRAAAMYDPVLDTEVARQHLEGVAAGLQARGVSVSTLAHMTLHIPEAIDQAARDNKADMIACTTHSHGALGSLLRGSVAWKVLAQSPVPVMLRHPSIGNAPPAAVPEQRRVLVPLDGSPLAEMALPLAAELAAEWRAPIDLVAVVPSGQTEADRLPMRAYLARISEPLAGEVQCQVLIGDPIEELTAFTRGANVTDIVMTSHGRTGLSRVLVGSVAYELLRRSALPVVVIPALAATSNETIEDTEARRILIPIGS